MPTKSFAMMHMCQWHFYGIATSGTLLLPLSLWSGCVWCAVFGSGRNRFDTKEGNSSWICWFIMINWNRWRCHVGSTAQSATVSSVEDSRSLISFKSQTLQITLGHRNTHIKNDGTKRWFRYIRCCPSTTTMMLLLLPDHSQKAK